MKIIEVPIFNEDGSIQIMQKVSPEEAQTLLQFALNFLATTGLVASGAVSMQMVEEDAMEERIKVGLND
jgi:hypothetical protein